ncbi:MAG: ABC transporter transmembrane domain-containing protein [Rhodobacteraceae bacterium]|nr:ABC transporter transmembrane domain-containing protein [Paracoccaceae bacterium]
MNAIAAHGRPARSRLAALASLLHLVEFVLPYWKSVAAAAFFLLVTSALTLLLPMVARIFVDGLAVSAAIDVDRVFILAVICACTFGAASALRYAFVTRLGECVVADIRKALFAHVIGLSPAFYEQIRTGNVLSRLNTDTTLVLTVISSTVSIAMRNTLLLIGGIGLMLFTSLKLTLLVLIVVPVTVFPALMLARRLKSLSRDNQDRIAESSAYVSEALLAATTVQANTCEDFSRRKFNAVTDAYIGSAIRRIKMRAALTAVIIGTSLSGISVVLWIGTQDLSQGNLSAGQLTQFVIYSVMVGGAVTTLSEVWSELFRAAGATERIKELFAVEDPVRDGPGMPAKAGSIQGEIVFKDVSFRYPMRPEVAALDGISFRIAAGETIALVGPSGAGKTTVFQMLLRFFDPQSGTIYMDGLDISQMKKRELRRQMALVPQDANIFADSARENIRFGWPDASDEEVEEAAQLGAVHEFLSELPNGYETVVGERGVMLSGGQKQRIAIARAFLRPAPILLLDEATSSLDSESEGLVQRSVNALSKSRTTLVIAHRLATVRNADRIIVLSDGRIQAQGTHSALKDAGGLYARLARLQFI